MNCDADEIFFDVSASSNTIGKKNGANRVYVEYNEHNVWIRIKNPFTYVVSVTESARTLLSVPISKCSVYFSHTSFIYIILIIFAQLPSK